MAVDFIEDIYQYSNLVSELRQVITYIRVDDNHHAVMRLDELFQQVCSLCKMAIETGFPQIEMLWKSVEFVKNEMTDLSLIGDVLEREVVPLMELWIQSLGKIEQQVDDTYILESSDSGFLTMRSIKTNMYIHSKNNPMDVARQYISQRYDVSKKAYSVFGCGLGYHVYMLYKESNGSIPIEVYEEDPQVVEYAKEYGVLDWIPKDRLKIITEDSVMAFLRSIETNDTGAIIYIPSVKQMDNAFEREVVMGVIIPLSTQITLGKDMRINSWRNIQKGLKEVSQLRLKSDMDEVVVVAAGPSLDDTMETIRRWQGKKKIICVGTVFRKLISRGIRPDFVVVIDPQERTLRQIDGLESETVPMILGVTAHWGFAENYLGEKYIVYMRTFDEMVENHIASIAKEVWPSGSTVTWMALEVALRLGAKKVYLAGVDLAYPGGVTHATDTLDYAVKKVEGLLEVCGVGGISVYTDKVFASYREEIENRIAETEGVTFYNLSQVGARIKGTIEIADAESLK